ncbi:cytosolic protein [Microcoleus sp. FACHB-1515]|uniref:PmeII family type II restriction endonuclease n=1 Tax=Cyanophyceae TaxID=3028117 RepID=UPI0016843E1D|nr:PmeII family type II restriction endonuclease [Microcoleus sp. FACHB-1515]MBD2089993.1 cytosolic protein [Microcoleus sp. FACHB-1515]
MIDSPYQNYYDYLAENVITLFYNKRLEGLRSLKLADILKRKNPYLFKAKNIELAGDLVRTIVDAFLSSQEETMFGNLLEEFAIFVSETRYGGFKSKFKSVDLEFQRNGIYYIVGIKSGTNWGNADQINQMKENFKLAKQALRRQGISSQITAVNGCMYGKDRNPLKDKTKVGNKQIVDEEPDKVYYKYAGQDFWYFISEDDNFYQEIIVLIDQKARERNEAFKAIYAAKVNEMTQDFMHHFMINNQIDWIRLIDYVSKRDEI